MKNRNILIFILGALFFLSAPVWGQKDYEILSGKAEDLWGSPIDLEAFSRGVTLIEPFSPAT